MTVNPANIEHILKKNFENYEKGEFMKTIFHDFLGDGIFNADGEQWKVQRKVASNIFNVSSFLFLSFFLFFLRSLFIRSCILSLQVKNFRDNMCDVFVQHGKEVMDILDKVKPGEAINMHDLFHRYTLDCIGDIGEPSLLSFVFLLLFSSTDFSIILIIIHDHYSLF